MEIRIKGTGIEIAAGKDLSESLEYGFTSIESLVVLDDDGNEVFDSPCESFKTETSGYTLNFNEFDLVRIDHESMECVWYEIDEWDPELLVIEKTVFETPEGDIEVITARYDDQPEDEMVPDELDSSVVWEGTDEGWIEAE